ncbi:hypothetical protein G7046_g388 [Stylonectria norvegica]|nr:hypothetical protein G7046_g388 [Stylonectria norvegica]
MSLTTLSQPQTTQTKWATSAVTDDPPQLSIQLLTRPDDRWDALKLVVDSVAQQRQVASQVLIYHPICLAVLAAAIAIMHVATGVSTSDLGQLVIAYVGIVISYLMTIRYFASSYIQLAETTDWAAWLKNSAGVEDLIVGARYGDEIIAALVLRVQDGASEDSGKEAIVRAWTTRTKYRRRGLGGDMLAEAVKVAKKTQGRDCRVTIAEDHANSSMPLHSLLNGSFRARNARASKALSQAVVNWESNNQ